MVTIRVLAFFSGCILALLKAVCSPLNKILAVNVRKLLVGMRLSALGQKIPSIASCNMPPDHNLPSPTPHVLL